MKKYNLIRDTKRGSETIFRDKTKEFLLNYLKDVFKINKYKVKKFKTIGKYIGFTVIKTPYNDSPMKIFYIIPSN